MLSQRDSFLQRVRQAVRQGQGTGQTPTLPERGCVGYQGAGADPVARFCQELTTAGGQPHLVPDCSAAAAKVVELVQTIPGNKVLLGRLTVLAGDLAARLRALGKEVLEVGQLSRRDFFAADLAISGVEFLIAETGSIVVAAGEEEPRSVSLLPPAYIAFAQRRQLLPDLFDLFAQWPTASSGQPHLPSCLTLITGPSKTGDIELKLVTGVHGPGVVHVVLQSS